MQIQYEIRKTRYTEATVTVEPEAAAEYEAITDEDLRRDFIRRYAAEVADYEGDWDDTTEDVFVWVVGS